MTKGQRVYEYVADDGTVYWSFSKHKQTTSPPKRLVLQSRVGTHITNYLVQLRQQAELLRALKERDAG